MLDLFILNNELNIFQKDETSSLSKFDPTIYSMQPLQLTSNSNNNNIINNINNNNNNKNVNTNNNNIDNDIEKANLDENIKYEIEIEAPQVVDNSTKQSGGEMMVCIICLEFDEFM